MRINNNISAMNTYSRLTSAQGAQAKSLEKLSSGLRINRAGDDAAGLAISEKMRGQIKGLNQSVRNAQDGISLIQTAEGALNETHSILNRMRELAVQSSNDTNTDDDRVEIQKEMDQLSSEITRVADNTEFNTQKLLNGTFTDKKFHIGANENQAMEISISNMKGTNLAVEKTFTAAGTGSGTATLADGTNTFTYFDKDATFTVGGETITARANGYYDTTSGILRLESDEITAGETKALGINVTTQPSADSAITTIDNAITSVSAERSKLGAVQNRLDHTINNLTATSENLSAAESRIRDVDMAKEMMEFTKNNILNQASTAMLAQANQMPQGVLQLLG
ncbi:MAG TPA: flagellin [Proteiniclasticum sp.]|nr:flagellin [Proteiniclasticum sp.]HBW13083.1 flagellin [Proteiniclasticum sp.]